MTLFLAMLFGALSPGYKLYAGKTIATTFQFYMVPSLYALLFFTQHLSEAADKKYKKHALNHNETHYAAVVLGILLGLASRRLLV